MTSTDPLRIESPTPAGAPLETLSNLAPSGLTIEHGAAEIRDGLQNRTGRDLLTIHLNDYFQGSSVRSAIPHRHWHRFERRIEKYTEALLDRLDASQNRATFFANGWIADQAPSVVREIARRGHEIASTGYFQLTIGEMTPTALREDAVRARLAIERASGRQVLGYRIACGWFGLKYLWVLRVLAEEGFVYDSSFCVRGFSSLPRAYRQPHRHRFGRHVIYEFPIPTARFLGAAFPVSGAYLRHLPHGFMTSRVRRWHETESDPWLLYFQASEIDADQPQLTSLSPASRLHKYRNIGAMSHRLQHYLDRYRFSSIADFLDETVGEIQVAPASARGNARTAATIRAVPSPRASRPELTIVVPCFDEEDNIGYLANALADIDRQHAHEFRLSYIFVDDGSRDDTLRRLSGAFEGRPDCTILAHGGNRGVAAASLTGIRAAKTEIVGVIDCDCSYDPALIFELVAKLGEDTAMVTASPRRGDATVPHSSVWRRFLSRKLAFLYGGLLRTRLSTYVDCVRVYRRSAVASLKIDSGGFAGMAEIVAALDAENAKIIEVPADRGARVFGRSKARFISNTAGHAKLMLELLASRAAGIRFAAGKR